MGEKAVVVGYPRWENGFFFEVMTVDNSNTYYLNVRDVEEGSAIGSYGTLEISKYERKFILASSTIKENERNRRFRKVIVR